MPRCLRSVSGPPWAVDFLGFERNILLDAVCGGPSRDDRAAIIATPRSAAFARAGSWPRTIRHRASRRTFPVRSRFLTFSRSGTLACILNAISYLRDAGSEFLGRGGMWPCLLSALTALMCVPGRLSALTRRGAGCRAPGRRCGIESDALETCSAGPADHWRAAIGCIWPPSPRHRARQSRADSPSRRRARRAPTIPCSVGPR